MKKTGIFYRSEPENLSDFMMRVIVVLDFWFLIHIYIQNYHKEILPKFHWQEDLKYLNQF